MRKEYIGKTCPYCKTPLVEDDAVVFCSVCDMPHHLSCWQDNQGCTTFGCTGSIKEIIGNDAGVVAAPAVPQPAQAPVAAPKPVQATPAKLAPASAQVAQTEKPIETLYESKEMVFMSDAPIVLENTAIIIDRTKDKLFARCTFRSITDKAIKAVLIEISCQDVWGSSLGEPIAFQYLDLKTKRESKFGQTNPIDLPDKTTRKIKVVVKKVLFADDSVADGGGAAFTMPAPILLSKHLGSEALAAEYARETSPKAQFVPEIADNYWRCACGSLNTNAEEKCYNCGCTKEQVTTALNPEDLRANMISFAAEKKAAAEKAQAEQAERIRRAEEEVAKEQKKQQEWLSFKAAQEQNEKKRKKTVRAIVISLIVIAVVGCGVVFFGIPYFNYQAACDALDNGEYDVAYQAFLDLDGFLDSDEMLTETQYQKACNYQDKKNYTQAIAIFEDISYYKNSEKKITECMYGYVLAHKNNNDRTTYDYLLTLKSANYKDAATIYKDLYKWRVTGIISTNANNTSKHESSISKYCDSLHCWFTLTGGTPGEKITVTHTVIYPDGDSSVSDWHWENEYDGSSFGCEWDGGLYTYPEYGDTGTLTIKVYNQETGELLGTVTTKITK